MPEPLSALIEERSLLLRQVAELGDFQPGSISSPTRKCGKPSCHCARPDDSGHGPHYQLTQKVDGKTVVSVGINRRGVVDERTIQERSSDHLDPEPCGASREGVPEALGRGICRLGIPKL